MILTDPTGETSEVVEKAREVGFDVYDILTFGMASGQQRELNKYHQETAAKGEKPTLLGELGSSLVGCGKGLVDTFNPIPNIEKAYTTGDPVESAVAGLKIAGLYGAGSSTARKVAEPLKKIINSANTKVDDAIHVMSSETGSFNLSGFTKEATDTKVIGQARKFWTDSTEFKGIKVYQRNDMINPNLVDARGRTNIQRMEKGLAPIGSDGNPINLHHMTQRNDSAIVEVTQSFHQQNTKVIHINPNTIPSGIDRSQFNTWKSNYWKDRANDFK